MNVYRTYLMLVGRNDGHERCHYCNTTLNKNWNDKRHFGTIDHIRPLSKGGKNSLDNLVLACIRCNTHKGNRSYESYLFQCFKDDINARSTIGRYICSPWPRK